MIIGVPKEIKDNEYRVSMTPAGTHELCNAGHTVLVETGAGEGSHFSNEDYQNAGAKIVSAEEAWNDTEMVIKVKEPLAAEYKYLRPDLLLFTYLHLAANEPLTKAMLDSGVTGVAYETVELSDGSLPLLIPMSEVAGRMAIQIGAQYLERFEGGRGKLLGGITGVKPANVVIIGGGIVGTNATQMALGMGASVTMLDISLPRLRQLSEILPGRFVTWVSSPLHIAQAVKTADLVIGGVLVKGAVAPKLVTREMISTMKKGSVIVDVAVDQGGCVETTHATTHSDPVYFVDGVLHYGVANMPGAVPRTSTYGLVAATLPYVKKFAKMGFKDAIANDKSLELGVNVVNGKLTYKAVADAFGDLEYTPLEDAI